jgi:hypothetical protein
MLAHVSALLSNAPIKEHSVLSTYVHRTCMFLIDTSCLYSTDISERTLQCINEVT